METSSNLSEVVAKIRGAFRPLECVVETYDFDRRIRFRVFNKKGEPLLTMDDILFRDASSNDRLALLIQKARETVEKQGVTLEPPRLG